MNSKCRIYINQKVGVVVYIAEEKNSPIKEIEREMLKNNNNSSFKK